VPRRFLDVGAKKGDLQAHPPKDDSLTIFMGVNDEDYDGIEDFISCASGQGHSR
jgi:glyceraldehyde-3-phosphate dehydrogenase/erythrose-4-phosphate dehydrogenase